MSKKILIIGNSANAYALAKKISITNEVFVAPGSDTIKDFAKTYDLTPSLVSRWLDKSVNMPLKFIKLGLRYSHDSLPLYTIGINCKKKVSCDGIIFDSITDCAKHYQVDRKKISRYLNGDVKMKQEWIEKDLKYV